MYTKEQLIDFGYSLTRENESTFYDIEKHFNTWDRQDSKNSHNMIEAIFNSYGIINNLDKRLAMITSGNEISFELYGEESITEETKSLPIASKTLSRKSLMTLSQTELTKIIVNSIDSIVRNEELKNYNIGDKVKVFIVPEGAEAFPGFTANIIAIHFFNNKVKYDLEIKFYCVISTRIYNIDSQFVTKIEKGVSSIDIDYYEKSHHQPPSKSKTK